MKFEKYINNYLPEHIKPYENYENDLEWFLGFAEGDGHWSATLPKNAIYHRHSFIITQKDPQVLFAVKSILGFGTIKPVIVRGELSHYRYVISDKINIERIIHICNGNLVLNKVNTRFKLFVETFNERPKTSIIEYIQPDKNEKFVTLQNGWFSGFIDAEACFNVEKNRDNRPRFVVGQSHEKYIINQLKEILSPNGGSVHLRSGANDHYVLQVSALETLEILAIYLEDYPLKSEKSIGYKRWLKVIYRTLENKPRQSIRSLIRLERLIKNIK